MITHRKEGSISLQKSNFKKVNNFEEIKTVSADERSKWETREGETLVSSTYKE